MLYQSFLKLGLVNEIRLMIAPVLLGDGLSLFGTSNIENRWRLKDVVAYKNGFVGLWYASLQLDPLLPQQPDFDRLRKDHVTEKRQHQDRPVHPR